MRPAPATLAVKGRGVSSAEWIAEAVKRGGKAKPARRRECPLLAPPAELLAWDSSGAGNGSTAKPIQDALGCHRPEFQGRAGSKASGRQRRRISGKNRRLLPSPSNQVTRESWLTKQARQAPPPASTTGSHDPQSERESARLLGTTGDAAESSLCNPTQRRRR